MVEAQIQKSQKLERISISLMNGPLDYSNGKLDSQAYKVQSEMEIWWIAESSPCPSRKPKN